jgi:hypothetical protein
VPPAADLTGWLWTGLIETMAQTEFGAARNQFVRAALGGVTGLVSYMAAVLLSILTCWLVNVASATRLAGITATIILLVPHHYVRQDISRSVAGLFRAASKIS